MTRTTIPDVSDFGNLESAKPLLDHRDMEPIRISDVDIHHPDLTKKEAIGLALGRDKVERYISKGRIGEAHGATSILLIFYQSLVGIKDIDTGFGEL